MEKKILTIIFSFAIIFWIVFFLVSGYQNHPLGLYTQIPLIVVPILGGLIGLKRFNEWGGYRSIMGKALFYLSFGMIFWGAAIGIWTYFLTIGIPFPYPSVADYVFVVSSMFHIIGLLFLSIVSGVTFDLKSRKGKFIGLFVSILVGMISYYALVVIAHNNVLKMQGDTIIQIFFNYAYTIASLVNIVVVGAIYATSRNYLGGIYKQPVLTLLVGFSIHFLAVFFFVKTISNATYFNGNVADILFTLAVFLESIGISSLDVNLGRK